jgi:hypothetical protein
VGALSIVVRTNAAARLLPILLMSPGFLRDAILKIAAPG